MANTPEGQTFFRGLTHQQTATALGVTERTIDRHWTYSKAGLYYIIRKEL